MNIERINNDVNGNPRFVIHFLSLLTSTENAEMCGDISGKYRHAISKSHKFGGRKFHNKQFGGGIVFSCYNRAEVLQIVFDIRGNEMFDCYKTSDIITVNGKTVSYIFNDTDICNLFIKNNPDYSIISQFQSSIFVGVQSC